MLVNYFRIYYYPRLGPFQVKSIFPTITLSSKRPCHWWLFSDFLRPWCCQFDSYIARFIWNYRLSWSSVLRKRM